MTSLYAWLMFLHLLGLGAFLFAHGVSGGASFLLREPLSGSTRSLLRLSQRSGIVADPAILVVIITGIWMTFAGHFSGQVWPWASLVLLVAVMAAMVYVARPYYIARNAIGGPDDALAERLRQTKPILAIWVGVPALVMLFALMVFKPF